MLVTVVIFLLILSLLVLIHEAGHFFVAKLFKIKVEEFGFGLPPRVFGFKFGETIYSINWLPIGGFVKLYGEDSAGGGSVKPPATSHEPRADTKRAFFARPAWQRATVIVAGVFMNFVLAVALISFIYSVMGVATPGNKIIISEVVKGSPAQVAGLKVGDTVESVNGVSITSSNQLISLIKSNLGKELTLRINDKGLMIKDLKVTPRIKYPASEGPTGIAISTNVVVKKYPWYEAPFAGLKEALNESWLIISGLGMIVMQLVTKGSVPSDVAGPVGIAQLTGKFVEIGPFAVMSFISLLSLNLAIVNILPIPALDGGRLLFIVIEAITRKKVNPDVEGYAHTIGMVLLLALIALITIHDLVRVFTGQPILPGIK